MKKLLYSLFAVFLALGAIAQSNDMFISGYVYEENTGLPISGAQVCVSTDSSNVNFYYYDCTTTNSNGYYSFSIPNGSVTGPNIEYTVFTWDCNNLYTDTVVANMQGTVDTAPVDFSICYNNQSCQADFSYTYGFVGGVAFNYTGSPNSPASFYWDFGDGSSSTLQNPSHNYNSQGPWFVTLTISTVDGCTSTVADTVWGSGNNLCDASFTYSATPSGLVSFVHSGGNNPGLSYFWDFGDGATSNQANPSHSYNGFGPYGVCLTITDTSSNCTATSCDTVSFNSGNVCQAGFSVSVDSSQGNGLFIISLTDQSIGNVTSYDWWVDGASYSTQSVVHTYQGQGIIGVCLSIETADSCTSFMCDTLFLGTTGGGNGNCQAGFQYVADSVPSGGNLISFYGSSSTNNAFYNWDFGDGQTSNAQNPDHVYANNGVYWVCLTVSDTNNLCFDTYCDSVVVGGSGNGNCLADFTVAVDSSTSGVYVVSLTDQSIGNVTSYNWWVDGASYSGSSVTHTYQGQGIIGVCLTIETADSCTSYLCDTLFLGTTGGGNGNCQASFQHTDSLSVGGSILFFYGSAGINSASYSWDFGDGQTSYAQNPNHVYADTGVYWVCLTVSDPNNQCLSTYCDSVVVGNTGGGNGSSCQAQFMAYHDSITLPPIVSNTIFFYDQSSGSPSYWSWDFGDNTTSNEQNPVHTYSNPGTYTVCLTIANLGSNCFDTYCATVTIDTSNTGNNCLASFNHTTNLGGGITFYGSSGTNSAQYVWSFGDGSSGTGQTVEHNYNVPGTYTVCLSVYGSNGCVDTYCGQVSYGTNNSGYCISGTVSAGTPNYPADYGFVYLISYDSQTNMLTAIDTTTLDSAGFYVFCNIPAGEYLVKAALTPNSIYYSNFLPTYYGNSLFWDYAQSVQVGPNLTYPYAPITLIAGNNPGGPGFIGGDVTQGANKTAGPGDPVANVLVMLLDINDDAVAYTYTNAQGEFQFSSVAYGTYKVYAEVAGLPTYPAFVTVDANNQSFSNIQIYQNTNEITTGVIELDNNKVVRISEIYPNPTNGDAFINFELMDAADITINVFSTTGQLISSETVQLGVNANQVEIATDNLNRGLYMVQFTEVNGQFNFNKQMVITK